ncbi:hypothetical protein OB955_22715 [Halobacteria archaeon AArc-m2/3/4]|uniref:Uncharacterized protein n=1 Tax=Natronoglomus mannanivorans TaxID=2979990 RepID=A0AAP3E3W8_9EURY|nr:hypothetical protein [Halobacteria archaeon AArc-xg1-1]MCU4975503.1 hypothetical protein [Halobacteria archaeon AArc-m2/3/4]
MSTRIALDDWDRVVEELEAFGRGGEVTTDEDAVRLEFGNARVTVTRAGEVRTGMPLHDFEQTGEATLVLDHDAGELTVEGDDGEYTFRRPGG